mmetsp:Transcript_14835/g.33016  ORF Transcript_14835/g.33016 Transcript_14835/m.33016 type:complete len:333 (+) Transcript_14835:168-1166(+)
MKWRCCGAWSVLATAAFGSADLCVDLSDEDTEAAVSLAQLRGKQTRLSEPEFELPEWHDPVRLSGDREVELSDADGGLSGHRGHERHAAELEVPGPPHHEHHEAHDHHERHERHERHRHHAEDDAEASFQRRVSELQELRQRDQEAFDVGSKPWNPVNSVVGDDRDALKQYAEAQHEISEAIASWEQPKKAAVATASRREDQGPSIAQFETQSMTPRERLALDMIVFLQASTGHSLHDLATKAILSVEISAVVFLIIRGYKDAVWAPPYSIVFGLVVLAAMVTSLYELDVGELFPVVVWVISWALFFWLWCHTARPIRRLATKLSGYDEVKG